MELLECRLTPAVNVWQGTYSTDADYNLNWSLGRRPDTSDEVQFVAAYDVDCIGLNRADDVAWDVMNDPVPPRLGEGSYDVIRLTSGYTAHVTLDDNLMVYELELAGGNLDQGYNGVGSAISVVEAFTWTAGTLNSTDDLSSLTFEPGSVGTIDPGVGNTLVTGSSLLQADASGSSLAGAVVTYLTGTLDLVNAAVIVVGQRCQANVDATNGTIVFSGKNSTGNPIIIYGMADVVERAGFPRTWRSENAPVTVAGGTLWIHPNCTADVSGRLGGSNGPSVQLSDGYLVLFDDATLKVQHSLKATGGVVATKFKERALPGAGGGKVVGTSTIDGDFYNNGAQVFPYSDAPSRRPNFATAVAPPFIFSKLVVTGDIHWLSGTYRPAVCLVGQDHTWADLWQCEGTFYVSSYTAINPTLILVDGGPATEDPLGQNRWLVLYAPNEDIVYLDGHELHPYPSITGANWCMVEPPILDLKRLFIKTRP